MQQTSVLMESDSQPYEKDWYVTPKHGHQLRIKWHKSIPIYRKARNQARKGLLYDPEAWQEWWNQAVKVDARMLEDLKPVRKGSFMIWSLANLWIKQLLMKRKRLAVQKPSAVGIFYDPQEMRVTISSNPWCLMPTTHENRRWQSVTRQPIFYHPEMWGN